MARGVMMVGVLFGLSGVAALAQAPVDGTPPNEPVSSATKPATSPSTFPPTTCSDCHNGEGDSKSPGARSSVLARSVHASLDCTDCHASISMDATNADDAKPHGDIVAPVDCGECHEDAAGQYKGHGRLDIGKDPDLPKCWSCHGTHDILRSSDRQSHVHPINLPSTCRACHVDVDLVLRHKQLRDKPIKLYESSVHGRASRKGLYVAATCNDCHSAVGADDKPTAHHILSLADPKSPIYHFNIPDTCGNCHKSITRDYWEGIHGQRVKQGWVVAPVCTSCHGEHGIISPSDPRSPVSAAHVAEATCARCHESAVLNEQYGVPAGRLRTYVDSYHGLKSKAGDVHVANCASCHGAHRILPHTDPTSSINPANLQHTCGDCHPGISAELASVPIHETAAGIKTGWPHFFTIFYYWLIGITIGLMLLHCIGDWYRYVRSLCDRPFVVRMTFNETMQHWVLMISFVVLVISGFSLRFSEAWWVRMIFGWGGGEGFLVRGTVHRVAAVVFAVYCLWHLLYLLTGRGRHWLRDMIATRADLKHIRQSAEYFLGLRSDRPRFGRFSYMEKCEYWALIWGAAIMSVTGVLLWFDDYFVERWGLPKGVLDVCLVIHYYEAWLATLAIFVWHGYSTVFSPNAYPMNPAWLRGRMPREMYEHEHADGPKLRALVHRELVEMAEQEEPPPRMGPPKPEPAREVVSPSAPGPDGKP